MSELNNYGTFLYGRLPIYTTYDEFDPSRPEEIIAEINESLSIHITNLIAMEYLYWYRRGVTPIYGKTKEVRPEINHKVNEAIYGSIVDFKDGYFLPQPCNGGFDRINKVFSNQLENIVLELNEYLYVSGKQQADNEVTDWFHTVGKGDLFVEASDDEETPYRAYSVDPRSAYVARSLKPGNPVAYGVHIVTRGAELLIDVWDRNNKYHLRGTYKGRLATPTPDYVCTASSIISIEPNLLGAVPIIEYQYNSVGMSAAESVIPLLDAINDKSNITVIISDNLTTAMTGGQDSAGTNKFEAICKGLGVEPEHLHVVVPLPKNMEEITRIIREEIEYKGVSVIIPRRECIQTLNRKLRQKRAQK